MNAAILLSGGKGLRLGGEIPKQYISVGKKRVITYALEVLLSHPELDYVVVVADEAWRSLILQEIDKLDGNTAKQIVFVRSGRTRQLSIWNGLNALIEIDGIEMVLIHDAARPNLTDEMISDCLETLKGHEGVMPVLPMKDTIYYSEDGSKISKKLDRNCLFAGQSPEAFLFDAYFCANARLFPDQIEYITGSSEPAILAGMDVVMIAGDEKNYKITTMEDLVRFKLQVEEIK